jgi:tRNA-splicing ligase RtcB (3'-phosphate/5'-hydroxy nucleic acid ligase)
LRDSRRQRDEPSPAKVLADGSTCEKHCGCDDAMIIEGVESPQARASLYSTVHGAGRLFGRKEAKRRFTREQMDWWLQDRGVTLIGADLDESPMAYRRLPEVIAQHAGTVKVLHTLRPFAVVMAGTRELDPWKD